MRRHGNRVRNDFLNIGHAERFGQLFATRARHCYERRLIAEFAHDVIDDLLGGFQLVSVMA